MKITKQIKPDKFFDLLKDVQKRFGFPAYYEELVIYLHNKESNIKLTVKSNRGIILSWRDQIGNQVTEIQLRSSELKNILTILKDIVEDSGYISVSPVYEFIQQRKAIKLINNSLIGPIITMINIPHTDEQEAMINNYCAGSEYKERIGAVKQEKVIDFSISSRGILNEKIISYIERNGIYLNRNKKIIYKEILESRTNDYSGYINVFSLITNHDLLSKQPLSSRELPNLLSVTVSIIIPCYNTEQSIGKVLNIIKNQYSRLKIRELEVILIDDGSQKPISSFISPKNYPFKLQIIRLEQNRGLSNARSIGVHVSRGEVLIFMDSDILLEKNYIQEHLVRNLIIPNAVFVSFKENVKVTDPRINEKEISIGLEVPNYSKDLRIYKIVKRNAVGSYEVTKNTEVEILESTNYFKSFNGSKIFGVYDLSCMVTGHNFSARKDTILQVSPFTHRLTGWGMEDVYFGLKLINNGNFIIPVLSTGVYHMNHPPRSGSEKEKLKEYKRNIKMINEILNKEIDDDSELYNYFIDL